MTDQKIGVETVPDEEFLAKTLKAQENLDEVTINEYWCEVCDAKDQLTEEQAFMAGWDYPPFIGIWGVVSPRTCPNCGVEGTAYWHVITKGTAELPEKHEATIRRILGERLVVTE